MTTRTADELLEQLYGQVPSARCQGKYQDSCGPIAVSRLEHRRMVAASRGKQHRGIIMNPAGKDSTACPFLNGRTGKCEVYAVRPMVCRLWGVVQRMRCNYGCVPERVLTDATGLMLLEGSLRIGGVPPVAIGQFFER